MAYARKAFRHIQVSNVEGTPGTAEAATEVISGIADVTYSDKVFHVPEEDRNSLSLNHANRVIVGREVSGTITGDLNQRIALWLFSNTIRGNVTPTQPAATAEPNAYQSVYEPGLTTANTPDIANGIDTYTLEFGDGLQSYEVEYVVTTSLSIEITPNGVATFSWEWFGRQLTETTVTGALTMASTIQRMPSNLATFYVDSSVANWGNTPVSGLLLGATVTFDTMFTPLYPADGTLYFSDVNEDKKEVTVEYVFRRGTNSELEKAKYDAMTTAYHRIKLVGSTEMDSAQSNPPHVLIDIAGQYHEFGDIGDEGGSTTETATLKSVYDVTGSKEYSVTVLTNLAALP